MSLLLPDGWLRHLLTQDSGAYCASVIITLLDLPLELPKDSPSWSPNFTSFLSRLPEWVAQCKFVGRYMTQLR